jgi:hypothetical protein
MEGDLPMTREEVRLHMAQAGGLQVSKEKTPELIVNVANGRPDAWDANRRGNLTYAVQRSSFATQAEYDEVVRNMAQATRSWEDACIECGVRFLHLSHFDATPSHADVLFIVRAAPADGPYIATAFFPSWPVFRRYVNIHPMYYTTTLDRIGVLRHELGHVLGYRHEHTRDVQGCDFEDNEWRPLTDYDPKSVMHYFCGNGGSVTFQLTTTDREGHRRQYPPAPQAPHATIQGSMPISAKPTLVVRFEGGEVADNIVSVAQILAREGLVRTRSNLVLPGQVVCNLYREAMNFPTRVRCPERKMTEFAQMLNPDVAGIDKGLQAGASIRVPSELELRTYQYPQVYSSLKDAARLKADLSRWHLASKPSAEGASGRIRLTFDGYELRVSSSEGAKLEKVAREIVRLDSANIYADTTTRTLRQPVNSLPSELLARCHRDEPEPGEASYASMLGVNDVSACAKPCTSPGCTPSRIFLIDRPVAANADLVQALKGNPAPAADLTGRKFCREVADDETFHGTHLAGIMVSQPNGFGFVGLSPSSVVENWDTVTSPLADADLEQRIREEANEKAPQVFVFASRFPPYDGEFVTDGMLTDGERMRFQLSHAARRIRGTKVLWITAAGQQARGKRGLELSERSALSPMNLGDLPNVVVVTACTDCSNTQAALLPEAHYSQTLVTIAAPGMDVPGWADGSSVTKMSGTSQATAFVGGVAAAMLNCGFRPPEEVKKRLILTARPVFGKQDFQKLQSGILDADLALRSPETTWLKTFGEPLAEAQVSAWCARSGGGLRLASLFDDVAEERTVRLTDILRITRYHRGPPKWVVFERDLDDRDRVKRSPPGRIADGPLLKLQNGRVVRSAEVEELLLATRVTKVEACE